MLYLTGQIQYINEKGEHVHSDICVPAEDTAYGNGDWIAYRQFLHGTLDEFIDKVVRNVKNTNLDRYENPFGYIELYLSDHTH